MDERKQPVWRFLFFALLAVVLVVLAYREYQRGFIGSSSKVGSAVAQSTELVRACHSFRGKPGSEGRFPSKLSELLAPQWSGVAMIDGGQSAITDPWGREYRYAVAETEAGPVPHVWCEWEYEGTLRLIGARLSADGKAQAFGLPE